MSTLQLIRSTFHLPALLTQAQGPGNAATQAAPDRDDPATSSAPPEGRPARMKGAAEGLEAPGWAKVNGPQNDQLTARGPRWIAFSCEKWPKMLDITNYSYWELFHGV